MALINTSGAAGPSLAEPPIHTKAEDPQHSCFARLFHCWDPSRAPLFQTGWFVESLMTQTLIIHVIRTNKIPFLQSRASWPLTATTLSIMAFGMWLPYSPLASSLGLVHLPRLYWPILLLTLLGYVSLTQAIKVWLLRLKGI